MYWWDGWMYCKVRHCGDHQIAWHPPDCSAYARFVCTSPARFTSQPHPLLVHHGRRAELLECRLMSNAILASCPAATSTGGASSPTSPSWRRAASWQTSSTPGLRATAGCSPARPSTPRVRPARLPACGDSCWVFRQPRVHVCCSLLPWIAHGNRIPHLIAC